MSATAPLLSLDMTAFRDLMVAGPIDPAALPIETARHAARALRLPWNVGGPVMAETREGTVAGLRCRLHVPVRGDAPQPFTIYLHGGGWTLLDIDTHDDLARRIAAASTRPVLLVDYLRAPEHAFPGALRRLHTLVAALGTAELATGLAPTDIVLSGDSAGANLALALSLLLREGGVRPNGLALLYGSFTPAFDTPSHLAYGTGTLPLTTARMQWFWDNYVPDRAHRQNPLAAPAQGDLSGLPAIFLGVAQYDILYDENFEIAARLGAAGVDVTLRTYPGTIHGFAEAAGAVGSPVAQRALTDLGRFIAKQLQTERTGEEAHA
ncbi:MAG TPA: alpha/beta hydrolase fold domain-containing protein [Lichenihabitans sp.]|jgi:acetyl esterase|nr:alpha/beta hydrolase fold domain-containing protein [Lichenihabitans sp.]